MIRDAYIKPLQPYLHLIILGFGLLGLISTLFFSENGAVPSKWHQFFLSFSSALLAGGIFAVIAKSHQLLGLFIQDIEKVIHSKEHYDVRNDKRELWLRAMKSYYGGVFPEIEERVVHRFDNEILCHNRDYYYKNATRWLTLSWADDSKSKVKVDLKFYGKIIPRCGLKTIKFKSISESLTKKTEDEFKNDSLVTINEKGADLDSYSHSIVNDMHKHIVTYTANIDGEVDFERIDHWEQDISLDSLVQFSALTYIDGLTLIVTFPKELDVVFNPYGVDEFSTKPQGITRQQEVDGMRIERQFNNLLFSEQGYILVLTRG